MQHQSTADSAGGSVSGLGVCDVWRLELSSAQWPWLADELDEWRGPLEEELERVRSEHAANPCDNTAGRLEALQYELKLVAMMREQLPPGVGDEPVVFFGPADLLRELVVGALREAVLRLSNLVNAGPFKELGKTAQLTDTAEAASSWALTFARCRDLERFRFDPCTDPVLLR